MTDPQTKTETPNGRRRKGRSPSYPGISLKTAVERAGVLYERQRRHWEPMGAVTTAWGFKAPTTGPASVSYAALKKFGLLDEEGSGAERKARLSDLAMAILMKPDPLPSIQQAALMPPIHRELWEAYGNDLPSSETLKWELVGQRGFTESGFEDFVRVYRDTIAFAQLRQGRAEPEEPGDSGEAAAEPDAAGPLSYPRSSQPQAGGSAQPTKASAHDSGRDVIRHESPSVVRIPLLLVGGAVITVEGEFPIIEAAWNQMLAVLQAMKPGLVSSAGSESRDS
jgi:hypothetical protein